MTRYFICILLLACSVCMMPTIKSDGVAEGRLLRGERWQPFVLDGNEADFYVAPNGNDSWSGTVAARTGGHAVSLEYSHRCELVGSKIRAVGGIGVHVGKGCYQNRVLEKGL